MDCIFCNIARGTAPAHLLWEDQSHMAFLSIFPNTPGFSVVIPKAHYGSYGFAQSDEVLCELVVAAKKTARLIDQALAGVARTGMILEGYGVDHLHAKLFPMHGTGEDSAFKKISSRMDKFFDRYEGYLSSHDCARADDSALAELAAHIRAVND
ncbi:MULTISPECIES: HIT family protein [Pseudomonas]|jgi:histidine triad (HIT) family protein|uniref:HIT family protein n=1 Tax=Pseudomonas quebecensis TaxID=2995174 RepID=A0ABY6QF68_9PSED|nr:MULTISPECIES: HIT family protein [Pseudomonas]MCP1513935.1 diadenosine tetraphosphate (Ap4A) HIT family hydrolase [Pseudomonas rhodesiae]MCX4062969.1 HIT family protein [Pseudomonas quebecensis]MDF9772814.1 diadenosine tetraphosphate (Ap4A) HIT family hydrolase [Pseudomonas rhodesiae]UZW18335.1 HIT family protein [Pseudomonas quebecensis]UZW24251.1 HIT family protein [Pseudomonas quebecensis]